MAIEENIIAAAQRLYSRNMLAAADGNISYKENDSRIIITPSGKNKAFMQPHEMAEITLDNRIIKGSPSSERLMHIAVYQKCALAKWVVHAHPPAAVAWSIAHPHLEELPATSLSELILTVGKVPIVPYARPGTLGMGDVLLPFLEKHRVIILSRHGALSWGETLEEALNGMERLEHAAQILMYAHLLGGLTALPPAEVKALQELRSELGEKSL